jgi:hypothetical protein
MFIVSVLKAIVVEYASKAVGWIYRVIKGQIRRAKHKIKK